MKKTKLMLLSFLMLVVVQVGVGVSGNGSRVYANSNLSVREQLDKLSSNTIKAGDLKSTNETYQIGEYKVPVYNCSNIGYVYLSDLKELGANIAWDANTKKTIIYDFDGTAVENPKFQSVNNIPAFLGRHNVYFNHQEVPAIIAQNRWLIPLKWVKIFAGENGQGAYNVINSNHSWSKEEQTPLIKGINVWFDGKNYIEQEYATSNLSDFGYNSTYINGSHSYVGYVIGEVGGVENPEKDVHKAWLKNPTYHTIPKVDTRGLFPTGTRGPVNKNRASKEHIEAHINSLGKSSTTNYLVWTDLARQRTYVFKGSKNNWELIRDMLCITGRDNTPTPKGTYKLGLRVPAFGYGKGYLAKDAYGFIGGKYLYHSVLYDQKGNYLLPNNNTPGEKYSAGCIRLAPENSKWLYNTMPRGTTAFIN